MLRSSTCLSLGLLIMTAALGVAQNRGHDRGPRYNAAAETTMSGTIEEVKKMHMTCHSGTHIVVKTDNETTEVALGPTNFLDKKGFEFKKGDHVKILGAKANTRQGEIFVSRQIIRGDKQLILRDAQGVPAWPREMCR